MGWEDRDYNDGGGGGGYSDYLGQPGRLLNYSVPFGTYGPVRVRLGFWMLLIIIFIYMEGLQIGHLWGMEAATLTVIILLITATVHEIGHRVAASLVGGWHNEFMLWPFGGMVAPQAPPSPMPIFWANAGGMIANLALIAVFGAWQYLQWGVSLPGPMLWILSAIGLLSPGLSGMPASPEPIGLFIVTSAVLMSIFMFSVNVLPFYIFDGASLLESILWPWTGRRRAINATCITGMTIAVPLFLLSLYGRNLLGLVFWALLFASSYMKRRDLPLGDTNDAADLLEFNVQASAQGAGGYTRRRSASRSYWGAKAAVKSAQAARREQAKIDQILDKVRDQGMQSLNWFERRALKQATERQRRR